MKVSVWLVPETVSRNILQKQIADIASKHNLPTFIPHVTLSIGGIDCTTDQDVTGIVSRLEEKLGGSGPVTVEFDSSSEGVSSVVRCFRGDDGNVKWNQSCMVAVNRRPDFMRVVALTRMAVYDKDDHHDVDDSNNVMSMDFARPFGEPHYSFAYGNDESLCEEVVPPISEFIAHELQVWCTSPATLAGVASGWKHLSTIRLCTTSTSSCGDAGFDER
mmetsp:Transcript_25920/g.40235  ORF Transcript_25920/g.40235 Transcript_25920/m.40235 type:complete len:218 (-) Transcript_25920:2862-3515(-)